MHKRGIRVDGIENYSELDGLTGIAGPRAGFGGATQVCAMQALRARGFASVINLRAASEQGADVDSKRAAAEAAGLNYIHMPMDPADTDQRYIADFIAAIEEPSNQPAYIHCHSATRVGALWMILRVLEDGWDIDQARKEAEGIAGKPEEAVAFASAYCAAHGK